MPYSTPARAQRPSRRFRNTGPRGWGCTCQALQARQNPTKGGGAGKHFLGPYLLCRSGVQVHRAHSGISRSPPFSTSLGTAEGCTPRVIQLPGMPTVALPHVGTSTRRLPDPQTGESVSLGVTKLSASGATGE